MSSSAPSDRTKSIFAVLDTPVTFRPTVFARCTANEPTPPDAPTIRTSCPDWMSPLRSPWRAVPPEIGTAAACSNVRFAGFRASLASGADAYSAKEPSAVPNTSSPGWNRVTFFPIASTTPATSRPRNGTLGLRSPKPMTRSKYGLPAMTWGGDPVTPLRRTASIAGWLFIATFVTSIPAQLIFYAPVLGDANANYVTGAGADAHASVAMGALLEVLLIIANIGTAIVLF